MNWFFGIRGYSFLDTWSIVHLAFWIFVGSTLCNLQWNKWWSLAGCLVVAFGWEVFEHFMAPRYPDVWKSPESWLNAWLSDPLMCVIGVLGIWWILRTQTW